MACHDWCGANNHSWVLKCASFPRCAGCAACSMSTAPPLVIVFTIPEERHGDGGVTIPITPERASSFELKLDRVLRIPPTARALLSLLHFDYEFSLHNGVDGRQLTTAGQPPSVSVQFPLLSISREVRFNASSPYLSRGQLGCFASHASVWDTGCRLGRSVVSMESDVVARLAWGELGDADFGDFDLVLLHDHPLRKNRLQACPERVIAAGPGWWYAMGATLIRPAACPKVMHLLASRPIDLQVDDWVGQQLRLGTLRVGQLCDAPRFMQTKDVPSRASFLVDGKTRPGGN